MNFLVCGKKNQSIEIKKDTQNIVFSNHIEYDVKSKTYRTPYENEVLSMMVRVSDKIKTGSKGVKPLNSRLVLKVGIETLYLGVIVTSTIITKTLIK